MNLWTAMNRLLQFLFFGALHGEVESSVNGIGLKYPSLGIEYVPRSWKFYNGVHGWPNWRSEGLHPTHSLHSITFMKDSLVVYGCLASFPPVTSLLMANESSPGRMRVLLVPLAWLYRASRLNLTYDLCLFGGAFLTLQILFVYLFFDVIDGLISYIYTIICYFFKCLHWCLLYFIYIYIIYIFMLRSIYNIMTRIWRSEISCLWGFPDPYYLSLTITNG